MLPRGIRLKNSYIEFENLSSNISAKKPTNSRYPIFKVLSKLMTASIMLFMKVYFDILICEVVSVNAVELNT